MIIWNLLIEYITDPIRVLCTIAAFAIPFAVYKINLRLHKYGDPPWKKEPGNEEN